MLKIHVLDSKEVLPQSIKNEADLVIRFVVQTSVGPVFDIIKDRRSGVKRDVDPLALTEMIAEYIGVLQYLDESE